MQKGAEVFSMIKAPFKRKSAPATAPAAAATAALTPKGTPRNGRGSSATRSISLGSSVNSLDADNSSDCNPINSTNIYTEIDVKRVLLRDNNRPTNNSDDAQPFDVGTNSRRVSLTQRNRINDSKNNLLRSDDGCDAEENGKWSSVSVYLASSDKESDDKSMKFRLSDHNAIKNGNDSIRTSFREKIKNKLSPDQENDRETEFLIDDRSKETISESEIDMTTKNTEHNDAPEINETKAENFEIMQGVKKKRKKIKYPKKDKKKYSENSEESQKKGIFPKTKLKNKSVNALLTSIKDFKNSRKNNAEPDLEIQKKDDTPSSTAKPEDSSEENEIFEKMSPTHHDPDHDNQTRDNSPENNDEDETNLLHHKNRFELIDELKSSKRSRKSSSKLKHNLKSKFKFPLKMSSKNKAQNCRKCFKERRKLNNNGQQEKDPTDSENVNEINNFCVCGYNDDDLVSNL